MDQADEQSKSGAVVAVIGGAAIVAGSIGTWAKVDAGLLSRSIGGMDGDGKITLALGALVALMALLRLSSSGSNGGMVFAILAAIGAGAVGIYDAVNVSDKAKDIESASQYVQAGVGWGLYVVIGGAALALVGALVALSQREAISDVPSTSRKCPHCAETIQAEANVCRFCGRDVDPIPTTLAPPPPATPEGWMPDPSGRHPDRWWDGTAWTKWVRDKPGGTRSEDPPVAAL